MEDVDNDSKLLQILVDQWDDSNRMVRNKDYSKYPFFGIFNHILFKLPLSWIKISSYNGYNVGFLVTLRL